MGDNGIRQSLSENYTGILDYFFGEGPDLSKVEAAALYVQFAKDGQESIYAEFLPSSLARNCYQLRHRWRMGFRLAAWGLLFDEIFRQPRWSYFAGPQWSDMQVYPSMGIQFMPSYCSEVLSVIFLTVVSISVALEYGYETKRSRVMLLSILSVTIAAKWIDVLSTIICLVALGTPMFSFSPLEGLIVLLIEKNFSDKIWYLVRTIPKLSILLMVLATTICTYTGIGFLIFNPDSAEGQQYFPTFGVGVWNMLMVLDGSNWPTPMIPAYATNRLYFIYFFVYLIALNWGLLNLILGFVFYFFKNEQYYATARYAAIRRTNMKHAFDLLDSNKVGYLTYYQVADIINEMFDKFESMRSGPSTEEAFDLSYELKSSGDESVSEGRIAMEEFMGNFMKKCLSPGLGLLRSKTHLNSVFNRVAASFDVNSKLTRLSRDSKSSLHIHNISSVSDFPRDGLKSSISAASTADRFEDHRTFDVKNRISSISRSSCDGFIKNSVCDPNLKYEFHPKELLQSATPYDFFVKLALLCDTVPFDAFLDVVFFIMGVIFAAYKNLSLACQQSLDCTYNLQLGIVAFTLFEAVLKISLKGLYRYRRSYRCSLDGICTIIYLIVVSYQTAIGYDPTADFAMKTFVIVRLVMLPRNVVALKSFTSFRKRYRLAIEHALMGTGQISFLLVILLVSMYIFAALGLQVFGGSITYAGAAGDRIANSYYGQSVYYPLNFNDILSGLVTMFTLLSVNNMHVTTSGFVASLNSQKPEIFFLCWYAIGVLFLINVLTSYFVKEFISYLQRRFVMIEAAAIASSFNAADDLDSNSSNFGHQSTSAPLLDAQLVKATPPIQEECLTLFATRPSMKLTNPTTPIRQGSDDKFVLGRPSIPTSEGGKMGRLSLFSSVSARNQMSALLQATLVSPVHNQAVNRLEGGESSIVNDASNLSQRLSNIEDQYIHTRNSPNADRNSLCSGRASMPANYGRDRLDSSNDNGRTNSSNTGIATLFSMTSFRWLRGQSKIEPHVQAAILLQFAREGLDYQHQELIDSERALFCYRLRNNISALLRFFSWSLVILRVFERPLWTFTAVDWNNPDIYPTFGIHYLSFTALLSVKLPIILALIFGQLLEAGYQVNVKLMTRQRILQYSVRLTMFLYSFIQLLLIIVAFATNDEKIVVGSTYGSIIYIFWTHPRTRRKLRAVVGILPRMFLIIGFFALVVLTFASFGPFILHLEGDDDANKEYFEDYGQSVWSIFVAITSSSYPSQIMPAYFQNRAVCVYFIAFICIGAFLILNLILVVVLVEYQKSIQRILDAEQVFKNLFIRRAFEALDVNNKKALDADEHIKPLLRELYTYYSDFRKHGAFNDDKADLMVKILDIDGDGVINASDFLFILDITRLRIKTSVPKSWFEKLLLRLSILHPKMKNPWFSFVKHSVKSRLFDLTADVTFIGLVLGAICASLPHVYIPSPQSKKISYFIYFLLAIEFALKIAFYGLNGYFRKMWHRLEFVLVVLLTPLALAAQTLYDPETLMFLEVYIRVIEVLRLLTITRVVSYFMPSESTSLLGKVIKKIFRSIYTLIIVFFCIGYVFMTIGVLAYGGLITQSPTIPSYAALQASNYGGANNFYSLNFNDYLSAFVTLFCCLHVSDFDVITDGLVAVTNEYSRIYFTAWYVIGTLLMLNLIKSFFLTEFIRLVDGNINDDQRENEDDEFGVDQGDDASVADSFHEREQSVSSLTSYVVSSSIQSPLNPGGNKIIEQELLRTSIGSGQLNRGRFANEDDRGGDDDDENLQDNIETSRDDSDVGNNSFNRDDSDDQSTDTVDDGVLLYVSMRAVKDLSTEDKLLLQERLCALSKFSGSRSQTHQNSFQTLSVNGGAPENAKNSSNPSQGSEVFRMSVRRTSKM